MGVAVIGCGYWGPNLIRNFFDTPGCHVVAACDLSETRLEAISRRHPSLAALTSVDDVLRDPTIDAVAIATPVNTHAQLAMRALEAGKHVLVEKPMTATVAEAEALVALADASGLTLMVDHTFVYTGAVRRIKQMIDTGELGNLYYYDSVRINLGLIQHDVSVIWDLAAHDLAIMDYLIAQRPTGISAVASTHFPGGMADVAYLTVRFADAMIAHFHVNWLSPVKVRQVLISGDRRMALYDDIESTEKVKVYDRGVRWNDDPLEARRDALVAYRLGDMFAPVLDQTEALRNECAHFIDCMRSGETPATDGHAGARTVRMLAAAERSIAEHGALVPLDD
ncbi:MAG: Gfo/Idh/MocA family oxidoreductase [Dehalococcoidia bacterium]|nr:Gfo/Idh/MocA family oxidoreductase [Dehalococcoidia bacterium]